MPAVSPLGEVCAEGHALQLSTAEAGRCEGCSRWVFGKEKVMSCACCNSYYCSVCAPQVRSTGDDHMWEDILCTLGSALRDCERMKNQITSEIDIDLRPRMERIRAAFNCQEAGSATLSAEQIVVEHAYEQVKSALDCRNPDTSQLHAHEEVIDRTPVEPEAQQSTPVEPAVPFKASSAFDKEVLYKEVSSESAPEQQTPVDLLDFSGPLKELSAGPLKELSAIGGQAPTDLLDISLDEDDEDVAANPAGAAVEQTPVDLMDMPQDEPLAASQEIAQTDIANISAKAPLDLLDMAAEPMKSASDEDVIIASVPEKIPMDLFDLSTMPLDKVTADVSAKDCQSLFDLSQSLVAPEVNEPMGEAAQDLRSSQKAPEPIDLL